MKTRTMILIGSLVAFCFSILVASLLIESPQPRPLPVTRFAIHKCLVGIQRAELVNGKPIEEQLRIMTDTMTINQKLVSILRKDPNVIGSLRLSTNEPPSVLDAWGVPLNFELRSRLLTKLPIQSPLRLLTNEFGTGDDVVLRE